MFSVSKNYSNTPTSGKMEVPEAGGVLYGAMEKERTERGRDNRYRGVGSERSFTAKRG